METKTATIQKERLYPLIGSRERLQILAKVRGMWKYRVPDPIKELKKMRKEWERLLSPIQSS